MGGATPRAATDSETQASRPASRTRARDLRMRTGKDSVGREITDRTRRNQPGITRARVNRAWSISVRRSISTCAFDDDIARCPCRQQFSVGAQASPLCPDLSVVNDLLQPGLKVHGKVRGERQEKGGRRAHGPSTKRSCGSETQRGALLSACIHPLARMGAPNLSRLSKNGLVMARRMCWSGRS